MSMTKGLRSLIACSVCALIVAGGCGYDVVPNGGRDASPPKRGLPDRIAGKACQNDAQCPSGRCAKTLSATLESNAPLAQGGYCTAACVSDADCGAGGECAVPAGASSGQCLATCRDQADCRKGYLCVDAGRAGGVAVLGSCQPAPKTDRLGNGAAGAACASDADCNGGRCAATSPLGAPFPGNYCTGSCFADADCGAGGGCLLLSGGSSAGQCFEGCASDADCARAGYRCRELNGGFSACYPGLVALPDGTAGRACGADTDCGMAGSCATVLPFGSSSANEPTPAPDGYCTQACDSDCGAGGACVSQGKQGGVCVSTCESMTDCRAGYQCAPRNDRNDLARICIPAMPTP